METDRSFFAPSRWVLAAVLLVLFGVGLAIRLYDLTDLPLDFQSTRQMHSAMLARSFYYNSRPDLPEWQRALAARKAESIIEPPILEYLSAIAYRAAGQELLWIPRLFSILFWLTGSLALFLLAKELAGMDGAVVGLAYFLVLPYAAFASRAFQPDPLMVCCLCWTFWAMLRWQRTPTRRWALAAGILGGLAILVKVLAVFLVAGAWIGVILAGMGLRKALRSRQVWLIAVLTLVPYILYHIYGMYIAGFLRGQYDARLFPSLWIDPVFYLRWNSMIASTVGFEWFLVALLGIFAIQDWIQRGMFIGTWAAYFVYGLVVPYHISTHDYYQEPLIPLVALGLAVSAGLLLRSLRGSKWLLAPVVFGVLLFAVAVKAWDVRVALKASNYRGEAVFYQKLGQKIGHEARVIGLTPDYGFRLAYWGWVDSSEWMSSSDFNYQQLAGKQFDMTALFKEQTQGKDLFVVTSLAELERQPELKGLLNSGFAVWSKTSDYVIYDLDKPLK